MKHYTVRLFDSTLFLITATHYIKQDLIATGLHEITPCMIINSRLRKCTRYYRPMPM